MADLASGKICYLEIPAVDIAASAAFYVAAFDWKTRYRGDGSLAFNDGVDQVSGTWVTGREPSTSIGIATYIMVADIEATKARIVAAGGSIVPSPPASYSETVAFFSDPAGNVLGLFEEPTLRR